MPATPNNPAVNPRKVTLLLGPAGSGKTWRCAEEIQAELSGDPDGPPLILLAPRQSTYQWERAILSGSKVAGYSRLQVVSFERLAAWVVARARLGMGEWLSERGRVMVLRALLNRHGAELKIFGASARMAGFAETLSGSLREMQQARVASAKLFELASKLRPPLSGKLHDLAFLMERYSAWMEARQARDADDLLAFAVEILEGSPGLDHEPLAAGLWVDGFAELTPREMDFLTALFPRCGRSTLAFCLEQAPRDEPGWLSTWAPLGQAYRKLRSRLDAVDSLRVEVELLTRSSERGRFCDAPALADLEWRWSDPSRPLLSRRVEAVEGGTADDIALAPDVPRQVSVFRCADRESEATTAAREILRHAREGGGRFREVAVLARDLGDYHAVLRRVFRRFEIPFFMDRRESVAHHPMVEVVRSALRLAVLGWRQADLFGALKSGLLPVDLAEVDWMESEAIARGWDGEFWLKPIAIEKEELLAERAEAIRRRVIPPLAHFGERLAGGSEFGGDALAGAIEALWDELGLEYAVEDPEAPSQSTASGALAQPLHRTVWRELQAWLEDLKLGFGTERLPLIEWLGIVESGLAGLTAGVIPPALDQVLIGSVDRARNPDLRLVLVLGLNEGVFPKPPSSSGLISENDRQVLDGHAVALGGGVKKLIGMEWFYGYIGLTRSRGRVVATFAERGAAEEPLNPSPMIRHLERVLPGLRVESAESAPVWWRTDRLEECLPARARRDPVLESVWPASAKREERLQPVDPSPDPAALPTAVAGLLYGNPMRSSVSRIEKFAACPFQFFVESGLRAGEKRVFDIDFKESGSLQHEILEAWHHLALKRCGSWRRVSPEQGMEWVEEIAANIVPRSGGGRFVAGPLAKIRAEGLVAALKSWIGTMLRWMPRYGFDPTLAEVDFGSVEGKVPPWRIPLSGGRVLEFRGKIDRIDLGAADPGGTREAVIVDYKLSSRKVDPLLLHHGIQMQLAAYLSVLRHVEGIAAAAGSRALAPVGGFYANLRGHRPQAATRREADSESGDPWQAYRHYGRFVRDFSGKLDLAEGREARGLFNFKLGKDGKPTRQQKDPVESSGFDGMLKRVENHLREFGERILGGEARLDPYRKGGKQACDHCEYLSICRIDAPRHPFRSLDAADGVEKEEA